MALFEDSKKRQWSLSLSVGMLAKLRTDAGFDISKDKLDAVAQTLFADPEMFARVLWVLVQTQADAKAVSPEDFAMSLDGDTIEAATTAFIEAMVDFFHRARPREAMKRRLPGILADVDREAVKMIETATLNPSAGISPAS